ncbi:hypothetical protein CSQ95_21980 [Janthinobacterium sp. BJB304]|nr:hypothetical protein CSQ95_21980 [Janthinobacterium sp. BJB304]
MSVSKPLKSLSGDLTEEAKRDLATKELAGRAAVFQAKYMADLAAKFEAEHQAEFLRQIAEDAQSDARRKISSLKASSRF